MNNLALNDDQIRRYAPSVFAERALEGMSDRYMFIPTTRVLGALREDGWFPVKAEQSKARSEEGVVTSTHVLRFRREESFGKELKKVGDSIPELVLRNSHNGKSAYEVMLGIFRLVCSNGLIVADGMFDSIKIRHIGFQEKQVFEASQAIIDSAPKAIAKVEEFRSIVLSQPERLAFAKAALTLKFDDKSPVQPERLLQPRRFGDTQTDLWTTLNVVQENILRGGIAGRSPETMRRMHTREVKSVNENVRLNKALWTLAENLKEMR